ncbi:MAG: M23 family metallopeptidase [Eubacteriales bacterium]|nr:M23 family metallopeptidase [Eubacteriales bacterium]
MKQTRYQHNTSKKETKTPKSLYTLALFLLVAVCATGFINSRKAAMEEEVDKALSMNPPIEAPDITEETPYNPDLNEIVMPDLEEVTDPSEAESQEDAEPITAPASAKDIKFALPLNGTIIQDYSADKLLYNKTLRDWRTHTALDIQGDVGAVVKAAAAGTVEKIYDDPLYGPTLILRHSDIMVTKYSSLQPNLPVSVGNFVEAGAPIGNVGVTATAESGDGAHLHFEVLENDKSINPKDLF